MTQAQLTVIVDLIRSARLDLSTEKRAQADLEKVLTEAGVTFEREVRLSDSDIADFLIGDIAVELKLRKSGKKAIYRQLCRYALHQRVGVLVLASNLSMGLPAQIEGKDTYFVRLGEGWL